MWLIWRGKFSGFPYLGRMVYFISRSEYERPHGRRIVEFPECENLLAWFQKHWVTKVHLTALEPPIHQGANFDPWDWQDQIQLILPELFSGNPSGLSAFLIAMIDRPRPESLSDVVDFIASFGGCYGEGSIEMVETAIQAHTDDDEIDICWYLFDSEFSKRFPERTAFLLHKQIELPQEFEPTGWFPPVKAKSLGTGNQATYCCFFSAQDGATIIDIQGCYQLPTRLPNLGRWLSEQTVETSQMDSSNAEWPEDLILLRALTYLTKNGTFEETLRDFNTLNSELSGWLPRAFSDYRYKIKNSLLLADDSSRFLEDINRLRHATPKSGEQVPGRYWVSSSSESKYQFTPHLCQVVFTEVLVAHDDATKRTEFIKHWIFFDDLWASANRKLAASILRYGRGEDQLGA